MKGIVILAALVLMIGLLPPAITMAVLLFLGAVLVMEMGGKDE